MGIKKIDILNQLNSPIKNHILLSSFEMSSGAASGSASGSSNGSSINSSTELNFRCSGCGQRECIRAARCVGQDMISISGRMPSDPVCASCGTICANLRAYGSDCLGYRGGVERLVRTNRFDQFNGHFYEEDYWDGQ